MRPNACPLRRAPPCRTTTCAGEWRVETCLSYACSYVYVRLRHSRPSYCPPGDVFNKRPPGSKTNQTFNRLRNVTGIGNKGYRFVAVLFPVPGCKSTWEGLNCVYRQQQQQLLTPENPRRKEVIGQAIQGARWSQVCRISKCAASEGMRALAILRLCSGSRSSNFRYVLILIRGGKMKAIVETHNRARARTAT